MFEAFQEKWLVRQVTSFLSLVFSVVSCVQSVESHKSTSSGSTVTFKEGSGRIAEIRARLLDLDEYPWTDRTQIWTKKQILDSHTSVKVRGGPYGVTERSKVCGD